MLKPGACHTMKHSGQLAWALYTRCEERPVPVHRASRMGVLLLLWECVPAIRVGVVSWRLVAFCWSCDCNDASIRGLVASSRYLWLEQGCCLHLLVKLGIADCTALAFARNWRMAYFHRTLLAVFCIVHIPSATSSSRAVSFCDAFAISRELRLRLDSNVTVRLSPFVVLLACFSMSWWCSGSASFAGLEMAHGR